MTYWMLIIVLHAQSGFASPNAVQVGPIATQQECIADAQFVDKRGIADDTFCIQVTK